MRPLIWELMKRMYFIVNQTDSYRLQTLVELAWVYPAALPVPEIARRRRLPAAYLARLVPAMVRDGLVHTKRGAGGGVRLAAAPHEVRLGDVLGATEGGARDATPPPVGQLEATVNEAAAAALEGLTLADLRRWDADRAPPADYVI